MADLYGLEASGLPPEHIAALRKAQRQQMIAESLMGQASDPLQTNQTAGGYVVPVNPLQGLSKVAQAYMGAKAMQGSDEAFKGIADKVQSDRQASIAKIQQSLAPITLPDASAGPPATMDRPIADRRATIQEAMLNTDPLVRSFASTMNSNMQADQTREDNQIFRSQEAQLTRDQRDHERALALEERKRQEVIQAEVRAQQFQQQKDLKQMIAQQGSNPFFQPIQTAQGVYKFNARTGDLALAPAPDGKPVVGAQFDPSLQGNLANVKESGKVAGKATTEAQLDLPSAVTKANLASQQIDELIAHPGFSSAVGATFKPFASKVDGTPEADFTKRLDQIKGGAFLQAFETLKGGGQITEAEGKKATEAIARMDKAQSEKEFIVAAREFQRVINQGVANAKIKAGVNTVSGPAAKTPSVESLLEKYK